ncbi:FAD-dependent oxidoreductase [Parafrankia sp. FMc2]|uniref:FAD-dependent oxidoreductase n=1 Tax=Parafrankia sp. FMc2 TaxID=3233196 RepID=UPI0034D6BD8C
MPDGGTSERRAAVIGGGIAGPAIAIALKNVGIESTVYEAEPAPRADGGFFTLAPNGQHVLAELGLLEETTARGEYCSGITFLDQKGDEGGTIPDPRILIERAALHDLLHVHLAKLGIPVEFGKAVTAVRTEAETAVAEFADGSTATADLMIACDGIHSAVRRSLFPDFPAPTYIGLVHSSGFSTGGGFEKIAPEALYIANGQFTSMGYLRNSDGDVLWWDVRAWPGEPPRAEVAAISDREWLAQQVELHQSDAPLMSQILEATRGPVSRFLNFKLDDLPLWHSGRVCLAGDAAHAISPHAGQGLSMALEDSVAIARCLQDSPDIPAAFAQFQLARQERVREVGGLGRMNDERILKANGSEITGGQGSKPPAEVLEAFKKVQAHRI